MSYYVDLQDAQTWLGMNRRFDPEIELKDELTQVPEGYRLLVIEKSGYGTQFDRQVVYLPGDEADKELCDCYDISMRSRGTHVYHVTTNMVKRDDEK